MTQHALPRSPELMRPAETGLLVIDVQGRLLAVQQRAKLIEWNCRRLIDGALELGLAVAFTEQVPEKLGPTVESLLAGHSVKPLAKSAFSAGECGQLFQQWQSAGIHRVLIAGIETHVCVQQTALDLLAGGFQVVIAVDAVGARRRIDHKTALRRLESGGALLTSTEAALFEWCERSDVAAFKAVSDLAKQQPPADSL